MHTDGRAQRFQERSAEMRTFQITHLCLQEIHLTCIRAYKVFIIWGCVSPELAELAQTRPLK